MKIREIARRLNSSDAAVIRFAIRSMLSRLAPLQDADARGLSLIPVFVECGAELTAYFDLDDTIIGEIINGQAERSVDHSDGKGTAERTVDQEDIALLAMTGLDETRVHAKLRELQPEGPNAEDVRSALRSYLYNKYIYTNPPMKSGG